MKFNKYIENLKVYEAGKPIELVVREFGINPKDVIKMGSNENPYGVSPLVSKAIADNSDKVYLYPDDSMFSLKEGLSQRFNIELNQLIIGTGSDQILEFITRAVLDKDSKILINSVTFAMYSIYSKQLGASVISTKSLNHNLNEFLEISKKEKPDIIFLCTPNNPTGDAINKSDLFSFLDEVDNNILVVIDGAYMEYAKYFGDEFFINPSNLINRYQNVIYLGTFSKAYGLGGMRVGYGIAQSEIIKNLYKLRPPFNITTLSLISATESLKDKSFVNMSVEKNFIEMKRFKEFANKHNLKFINSYTNFITIFLSEINSTFIANQLLKKGIIIRDLQSYGLNAIRITIGKSNENSRFLKILNSLI
jgi:histidinol-phosphate aminotransferase